MEHQLYDLIFVGYTTILFILIFYARSLNRKIHNHRTRVEKEFEEIYYNSFNDTYDIVHQIGTHYHHYICPSDVTTVIEGLATEKANHMLIEVTDGEITKAMVYLHSSEQIKVT
jgi:peptidoglycan/xylan/chitin deacetylase (PgdA/CDA1 family)